MLFLVRHAKAGDRLHNAKDDFARPLTKNGWAQAEALVDPLIAAGASGPLLSSPFVRCMQTLKPLAKRLGADVRADENLRENSMFMPVIELMDELPDGAVLSSHGDVVPDVIAALQRRGCEILGTPHWKKASVWLVTRDADGTWTTASSWAPPA